MNSPLTEHNTEAVILAGLIQTRQDNLTPDAANYLLSLQFGEWDRSRMNRAKLRGGDCGVCRRRVGRRQDRQPVFPGSGRVVRRYSI